MTGRAVTAGYLTQDTAGQWLDHLATQPFFASVPLFITTATARMASALVACGIPLIGRALSWWQIGLSRRYGFRSV